ncbi:glycosyltransferase family 2 protein [Paenibacillus sp. GYB003]|uniref:glycosyltransferase family 2 protein n=1 Tax=Paenibacillus sp. GYB003 TaxID=2994392 RepID=UPI002F968B18
MITVSLCMIVKNEADVLARCLESVQGIADEIVIVDTGSTDETKRIAAAFTDRIFDFEWVDDFAAARNFSFAQATKDYILWLDADDVFEQADREKFIRLKETLDPSTDSVMMHYHLSVNAKGEALSSLRRNRLVRRDRGFRWEKPVHELLVVAGNIVYSDIAVTHKKEKAHTDRNLRIYRKRAERGEQFDARDLYYFANEWKDNGYFAEAIQYYERFLATKQGWSEDCIAACLKMADCFGRLNDRQSQLRSLLRSLLYGRPRAEMCCRAGALFLADNRLEQAVFWYTEATRLGKPDGIAGMVEHEAWTWLPHLQLCLCHDRLGNTEKAREHNEIAASYVPNHPGVLHNKAYFERIAKRGPMIGEGSA